jgi:hypothetical protein
LKYADEFFSSPWRRHKPFLTSFAVLLLAVALPATLAIGRSAEPERRVSEEQDAAATDGNPPNKQNPTATEKRVSEKQDAAVRMEVRNVRYRLSDDVAVHVKWLTGALVPAGDHEFPVVDDKDSFQIRIDAAEVTVHPNDLANVLNSYVFARPKAPLAGLSVVIENGQLKIKGKLHDKGGIPFETQGTLSPTSDGKVRLHSEKIKALHVPVKGLMDAFGVEIDDLIKTGKVPGVAAEGDDLILDLAQMLPPPHIEGSVTAVRVEGNHIAAVFGPPDKKPPEKLWNGNYVWCQGNRLRVGNLTMNDTNIVLSDLDPNDALDLYLDHYKEQLAAGYAKVATNSQVRVYVKDFDKLGKPKAAATKKDADSAVTR